MAGFMTGRSAPLADQAEVDGACLMTATAETALALAPKGAQYTAFTGALLATLHAGVPDGPSVLDMETLFAGIDRRMRAKNWPAPQRRSRNAGHLIALARNTALAPRPTMPTPEPTTFALRRRLAAAVLLVAVASMAAAVSTASDAQRWRSGHRTTPSVSSKTVNSPSSNSPPSDPAILTVADVFPHDHVPGPDGRKYPIFRKEENTSCAQTVTGKLVELLPPNVCLQIVRASTKSVDGRFLITAGIINFSNAASAVNMAKNLGLAVGDGITGFLGLPVSADIDAPRAKARVYVFGNGRYIAYIVLFPSDYGDFTADDEEAERQVLEDLALYLGMGFICVRTGAAWDEVDGMYGATQYWD
jgi:hypothetical protein